ncbi:hypothetical protein IV203_020640 [Nitzschia inconspicua]|uniref:Exonuclease domain-containing protein n=1 Tax=Nitzschia inconspicua TaxID=303405 RepID=A0A9K3K6L7_9STRA|nr:hypothetical protein IV203_034429 [Nitzschia inconspicua]KAG7342696.1 hypothetical protein IV203_020640 [Nitzschia inconspicua]
MRDNKLLFESSKPTMSPNDHQRSNDNGNYHQKQQMECNTPRSNTTRSRGSRHRKKAHSLTTGGNSVASSCCSDAGSWTSGASNSPAGKDPLSNEILLLQDSPNSSSQHNESEKKKSNGRRRRKPKLRNKVDGVFPTKSKHRDNHGDSNSSPANTPKKYTFGWNTTVCPASKGGPTSKKQHDAPMMKRDLYFALHCERVAIGNKKKTDGDPMSPSCPSTAPAAAAAALKTDAVARVTLINWDNETILDTFVKVPVPVTDFYDTGIKPEQISTESPHAKSFASVRQTVESTLKGKILIGHEVENHLMMLGLTHPWTDTRDSAKFFQALLVQANSCPPPSLEFLCKERLQRTLPPLGHAERPMQNCIAALDLYKKNRKEWEEFLIAEAKKKDAQLEDLTSQATRLRTYSYASSDQGSNTPRSRLGSSDGINNVNVVALHCTAVETHNNVLVLARATVLNCFHQVLWDSFVQIHEPIVDAGGFGVLPQDVLAGHGALPFDMVRHRVEQLLRGKVIVGYKLAESLSLLGLVYPSLQLRDIAYFRPFTYVEMDGISGAPLIVERSLEELCVEVLQKPFAPLVRKDRAIFTCSAVLELYDTYQDQWEQEIFIQQQQQVVEQSQSKASWFNWGKRQQPESTPLPQYQLGLYPTPGSSSGSSSVALSSQAFQVLHGDTSPSSPFAAMGEFSNVEGSSFVGGSSFHEDSSSYYEPSLKSRLDDSSQGILETFTADSAVSSIHDDTSSAGGERPNKEEWQSSLNQKSSSWFRFGSRKSRFSSPSSCVSMMAVQENAQEEPSEIFLGQSAEEPLATSDVVYSVREENGLLPVDDAPSSRTWFGFGRRSTSPGRTDGNTSRHGRSRSLSPESPFSGQTAATNVSEVGETTRNTHEVTTTAAVDAIEIALSASTGSQMISALSEVDHSWPLASAQTENSYTWFGFRRSKSHRNTGESHDDQPVPFESVNESSSEPDVVLTTTEKTDTTDDGWLQEVMSQSTGQGANDDLNSVDFASLLESDVRTDEPKTTKENLKSGRGQSSWFGFKRSKTHKTSGLECVTDSPEEIECSQEFVQPITLPHLVAVDKSSASGCEKGDNYQTIPAQLGVTWNLGNSSPVTPKNCDFPDESILSRSRLPTESTVPTVSMEEEDDSAGAFTEEFEKGVAQSFAYLEI